MARREPRKELLYVAVTPAHPGCVKVGRSADPFKRLRAFDSGIPNPYAVVFMARFKDVVAADASVKGELRPFREGTSECYRISVDHAIRIIKETPGRSGYEYPLPGCDEHPILLRRVDELEITVRTARLIAAAGIQLIGDLVQRDEYDLSIAKLPSEAVTEITEVLELRGLGLGMRIKGWPYRSAPQGWPAPNDATPLLVVPITADCSA